MSEQFEYSRRQVKARTDGDANANRPARVRQRLLPTALQSLFAWRLVFRELLGAAIAWGAYAHANIIIGMRAADGPLIEWVTTAMPVLFWITVVVSVGSVALASVKSAIPAVIALVAFILLGLLGLTPWYLWALLIANICVILYAIGFAIHGGHIVQLTYRN